MTVACHVIPASGRLVDVDIPELSESVVQISARPKVTIAQTSRLFISILYIAAVVIVRIINSRPKKN